MFNLKGVKTQIKRVFDFHDGCILFYDGKASFFMNLHESTLHTYENSHIDKFSKKSELLFKKTNGKIFEGFNLIEKERGYYLWEFLDSNYCLASMIEERLPYKLIDYTTQEIRINHVDFAPRAANLILYEKDESTIVVADGKAVEGGFRHLYVYILQLEDKPSSEPVYSFKFEFPNHASVGTRLNEKTHILKILGIINNKLYVSFTDNSLMIIDIEKGEVLKRLGYSDGGKRKRDSINHLVTADFLGGGNVDESKGYLFNLWNSVMYYFDAETEEITQIDLTEELKDKNLEQAIIKYFDDDIIAILDLRAGGVGIIDRHTHKLVWHQTMYFEGKKVRPLELKISGNYMCITDSAEQLHIFERTIALTEEN